MKTVTEINGFTLRNALKKAEELTAAGKTAEELPAALGEALKAEGDKLKYLLAAMELAKTRGKELGDLKRVLVYALNEGEAAPSSVAEKDGNYYAAEYLASLNPPRNAGKGDREDRGGKRGGRDGKRGGGRGGRDGKPGRGGERGAGGGGGGRGPRRDDAGRGPRPTAEAGAKPKITPVGAPKITPKTVTPATPKADS